MDSTSTIGLFVLGLLVLLIAAFFWRRTSLNISQVKEIVADLVAAAEMLLPGQDGGEKLNWVIAQANTHGLTKYIEPTLLRNMIEAAVLRLKYPPASASHIHTVNQDEKTVGHRRPL